MHLFADLYMESVWQVTLKISQLIYFQYMIHILKVYVSFNLPFIQIGLYCMFSIVLV